jgi:hypothetical protein
LRRPRRGRRAQETSEPATPTPQSVRAENSSAGIGKSALQAALEGAAVFRSLAEWHALRQRCAKAAERFATLVQVNQLDGWNIASMDHLGRGAALLARKDRLPIPWISALRRARIVSKTPRRRWSVISA